MKIGKKRMLSDVDFSSKSGSVSSSDELAPPSLSPTMTSSTFSQLFKDKENLNINGGKHKMTKEELKQLLIKAIVPEVVASLGSFA